MSWKSIPSALTVSSAKSLWLTGLGSVLELIFFVGLEDLEDLEEIGKVADWEEAGG